MLQMFHMDVAKVDADVAYVAMVVNVCCKHLFQMFHLFFPMYVASVLSRCCICFTHMLQVFYLDAAYVHNGFKVFLGVFTSVSGVFGRMLQALHLDIAIAIGSTYRSRLL
jgi:hypothetical protein